MSGVNGSSTALNLSTLQRMHSSPPMHPVAHMDTTPRNQVFSKSSQAQQCKKHWEVAGNVPDLQFSWHFYGACLVPAQLGGTVFFPPPDCPLSISCCCVSGELSKAKDFSIKILESLNFHKWLCI